MDGFIIFRKPLSGLQDSTGAAITAPELAQLQVIPKRTVLGLRVVQGFDRAIPNRLISLILRLELPSVFDPLGAANPQILDVAQLDYPNDASLPDFYAYVDTVKLDLLSDTDATLEFKTTFP